jgi:glycosyltransferase involved in cell wall biosynthesis
MVSQITEHGGRHIRLPVGEKGPRLLTALLPLRRLFASGGVDVLHLRSRLPAWAAHLAMQTLSPERRPCVVSTFHSTYSVSPYTAIMAKGDASIAISHFVADYARRHYKVDPRRLHVIHRGVDPGHFTPERVSPERVAALRKDWDAPLDGPPVVLMPARMSRVKGHALFIRALALAKDAPWTAVCLGGAEQAGSYKEELLALAGSLGIRERLRFPGHAGDMAAAYLAASVVVAVPARPEPFGRVAIEAQAMGRPVIAAAAGGHLETVLPGATGWLVGENDPASLARALARAVSLPEETRAMGVRARQWASGFTTLAMCEKTFAVYARALREREL